MMASVEDKLLSFEILLDNATDVTEGLCRYVPGDVVRGNVRLVLADKMEVNGMDLTVQGHGTVHWRDATGKDHMADEIYLNELAELVKAENFGDESMTLSKGEHIFPFECDLPKHLPSTIAETHGSISYLVKCLVRPGDKTNQEPIGKNEPFIVQRRIPVSPQFMKPYHLPFKKTFSLSTKQRLQCGYSALRANMYLSRRGYIQGETVMLNADVVNGSNKVVKQLGCALIMHIEYNTDTENMVEHKVICDREDVFKVDHMEGRKWKNVDLQISDYLPSSGNQGSKLIKVTYEIIYKLDLLKDKPILMRVPIEIGMNVPEEMRNADPASTVGSRPNSVYNATTIQSNATATTVPVAATNFGELPRPMSHEDQTQTAAAYVNGVVDTSSHSQHSELSEQASPAIAQTQTSYMETNQHNVIVVNGRSSPQFFSREEVAMQTQTVDLEEGQVKVNPLFNDNEEQTAIMDMNDEEEVDPTYSQVKPRTSTRVISYEEAMENPPEHPARKIKTATKQSVYTDDDFMFISIDDVEVADEVDVAY